MEKKEALNQEMTMDDASRIKNMTSGQVIPEDLDLKNLLCDEMVLSFDEALYNGKKFFHMTQVPPHKMITLNENDYRDNYIHGMNLSNDQLLLIQELDTNSVLLPDKYVRDHYEYRHQNGGVPNPHIYEPKTNPRDSDVYRKHINVHSYLCSDLLETMAINPATLHPGAEAVELAINPATLHLVAVELAVELAINPAALHPAAVDLAVELAINPAMLHPVAAELAVELAVELAIIPATLHPAAVDEDSSATTLKKNNDVDYADFINEKLDIDNHISAGRQCEYYV